jgi:hypothetical protein
VDVHISQCTADISRESRSNDSGKNKQINFVHVDFLKKVYATNIVVYYFLFLTDQALAKFRCGVPPISLETGRYEHLQGHERICPLYLDGIENEMHVIIECSMYDKETIVKLRSLYL